MKKSAALILVTLSALPLATTAFAQESDSAAPREITAEGVGGLAGIGGGVIVSRHHKDFMYYQNTDDLKWTKAGMRLYDVNKGTYENGEPLKIPKGTKIDLELTNLDPNSNSRIYSRASVYVDKELEGKEVAQYLKAHLPADTASLVNSPSGRVEVLTLSTAEGRVIRGAGTAITWAGIASLSYSLYKIATGGLRTHESPDADPRMITSHSANDPRLLKGAPEASDRTDSSIGQTSMNAEAAQ